MFGFLARPRTMTAAVAAALLLGATNAYAQLENYVIQGERAERIMEKNALSIDVAKRVAEVCANEARERDSQAAIAILDQFGLLIYFERMDGIRGTTQIEAATSTRVLRRRTADRFPASQPAANA